MKLPVKKWGYTEIPVFLPRNFACGAVVAALLAGLIASVTSAADGAPSSAATGSAPAATAPALPPLPPPPPMSPPAFGAVPKVPPAPLPEALAAAIAEAKRKALSGEDTATTRLQALATDLDTALAALKQLPPDSTKYFAPTLGSLLQAQTAVSHGLDYVKAHPEDNSLASRVRELNYYGAYDGASGGSWGAGGWAPPGSAPLVITGGKNLATVEKSLRAGYDVFIGFPQQGRPIIGEIGGNRDLIMRAVVVANMDLVANNVDLGYATRGSRATALAPASATTTVSAATATRGLPPAASASSSQKITLAALAKGLGDPDHTGSIAGTAEPTDPVLFVYALVCVTALENSMDPSLTGRGGIFANVPATYADDKGNFVIKNLPPGFYVITATGGSMTGSANHVVVEVKEGAETKLPAPLKYTFERPMVGG